MWPVRSSVAQGQTPRPVQHADRGFAGVGVLSARDDSVNRVRFRDEGASRVFLVEADVFRVGRAGFGVELSNLGTVTGRYDTLCCILRDEQKEISLLGVLRERVWRTNRVAVDIMGGAGVLLQHRETSVANRFAPAATAIETIEDRRSPAFALGIDVPLLLARHVALAPEVRLYCAQRGTLNTANVTRASSQRPAVGLSGRVVW